jgi:hypothetical protein
LKITYNNTLNAALAAINSAPADLLGKKISAHSLFQPPVKNFLLQDPEALPETQTAFHSILIVMRLG